MKHNSIHVEVLLQWAQAHLRRESAFLYPRPQVVLEANVVEFWDFVIEATGMSGPDELNAMLDRLFPFPEKAGEE